MPDSYASLDEALSAIDHRRERPFRCHVHADGHASASVNVLNRLWFCYTCGARGKAGETFVETDTQELRRTVLNMLDDPPERPSENSVALYVGREVHPYWLDRFSEPTCRFFGFGFDHFNDQPCYPMRDATGELVGWVRRNPPDVKPKYKYPVGVKAHHMMFNYCPGQFDDVILVEGAMDVAACHDVGFTAWGIYGSKLSKQQVALIHKANPARVFTVFDNDAAGRQATTQTMNMLDSSIEVIPFIWQAPLDGYNDIAELPLRVRRQALEHLVAL